MNRFRIAVAGVAWMAMIGSSLLLAQGQAPKTIVDPKDQSPEVSLQGEYVGSVEHDGNEHAVGAQVIDQGKGKFLVKVFPGGLPGAGWNGKQTKQVEGKRSKTGLDVSNDEIVGTVENQEMKLKMVNGTATATLKRTERKSPTLGMKPPEGAVVLYGDAADAKKWKNGNTVKLSDGEFLGIGVKSEQAFQAFTMHLEFRLPYMPEARGQGRANSGLYLQDRYEVQILDSFGLNGENNECGGVYQQYKPLVNMCLPPMVWQTYDIDFTPAKFDDAGKKIAPARATVKLNGVVIHEGIEFKGATGGGQPEKPSAGPFQLQNHGNPLVFRNIWVVEKK
ncbi:3-keto-disaccharide hydrolase [Tuwongella immobilis]|uniref:3-keto-alpha-glucoside-1,2-lyase/3-keto-2-hydroxy-glucal hydratase domain-containing protein n=1 Tax=Tuwongella immobilis TaxID=692036 RepID=A0A6C2YQ37_9BACT|nr:DUF1080 domain-containing protein [Tuwongella immobilis]VIP03233.1 Putative large multi-functional protein OS=Blastopirellula marina DSM 3645 GN=DSM3645_20562 PE=4 SV=1: DUF1080 [Tuwongella immobilis]VTS03786.1 Putative large multi-functional protein OS=Blastopirellula marina DSM 3645 GN=DSM3645_20562 PE=4 SV=1: DUF1080 [Tuwongella immobilis]